VLLSFQTAPAPFGLWPFFTFHATEATFMDKRTFNLAYGKPYTTTSGENKKAWIQVGRLTIEP